MSAAKKKQRAARSQMMYALTVGGLFALFAGLGSCSTSLPEVCSIRFPQFEEKVNGAIATLARWGAADAARMPARVQGGEISARSAALAANFDDDERRKWENWSEGQLKDFQHYIDLVESDPQWVVSHSGDPAVVRFELSQAADELVALRGYSNLKMPQKMALTLNRILEHARKARESACGK